MSTAIPADIRTAIANVINYNWADEERDYVEHGETRLPVHASGPAGQVT